MIATPYDRFQQRVRHHFDTHYGFNVKETHSHRRNDRVHGDTTHWTEVAYGRFYRRRSVWQPKAGTTASTEEGRAEVAPNIRTSG